MKRIISICVLLLQLLLVSCSEETVANYVIAGTDRECCKLNVRAGNGSATFEIQVLTDQAFLWERNCPSLSVEYSSAVEHTGKLKGMDVNLFEDGVQLKPTIELTEAGYGDAFGSRQNLSLNPGECCANLDQRMPYAPRGDDQFVKFGVTIHKKFASTWLPARMTLVYTVTTDQGTFTDKKELVLVKKKQKARAFIRFH
ncbi:MAG: hypothetical protein K8S54_12010 [Spirochaetia bacterium]|nr:hypothetical protein [Spirochaetia bacterium]